MKASLLRFSELSDILEKKKKAASGVNEYDFGDASVSDSVWLPSYKSAYS